MTIIDSLIVKLGVDNSGVKKGTDAAKKDLKDVKGAANDTSKAVNSFTREVGAFLAVLGGTQALKHFITDTIDANAAVGRLATNLGIGVEGLSAWSGAAEVAGGSTGGLQSTVENLSRAQTELQITGQSSLVPYLSALGVSMADAGGKARPVTDILLDLSDKLSRLDRPTAFNMGKMMGIDSGTLNLILKGRREVEGLLKRQQEIGVVTKQQAEQSQRLKSAWTELSQTMAAGGRSLLSELAPALEKVTGWFQQLQDFMAQHGDFVVGMIKAIGVSLGILALAATPISATAAVIGTLAGAFALLYEDYQKWKKGEESLLDWSKWEAFTSKMGVAVDWIHEKLSRFFFELARGGDMVAALMTGDPARFKRAWSIEYTPPEKKPEQKPAAAGNSSDARKQFVEEAARILRVNPAIVDAHLRTETGATGRSTIGQYNYGNIKAGSAWGGATASRNVLEYNADGTPRTERAAFRAYGTPQAGAQDYARLISSRYPGAVGATDAASFAQALKAGGYATDPNYVNKIASVARGIPGASSMVAGVSAAPAATTSANNVTIGAVTVHTAATDAAGIARDFGSALNYELTAQVAGGFK